MEKRKAGRPPGSKDKKKRKKAKRAPRRPGRVPHIVTTPKHFQPPRGKGHPRKDGMPPIQRKKLDVCPIRGLPEPEPLKQVKKLTELLGRIRHMAGRGLMPPHIAVLTGVTVEDLSPGGLYYQDMEIGIAEAVLAAAENHYDRVLRGKSTHEVMFYLRSIGKWAETADGRKKSRGEVGEPEETKGFSITFDDDDVEEDEDAEDGRAGASGGHGE
jgi:hypothetical protein